VLCDIEGFSYEEIAVTLGVKLGTVRSRIHRGRAQLRAALEHRRPAPADATSAKGAWDQGLRRQGLVPRLKRSGGS
jgi:RNA polymerase sigma-70 factor (ECF subfamily)